MEAEVRPTIRARDREEKFAADELRKLGRTRLLRHADPGILGRPGRGHDFLRPDARRSGARGRGDGRGAERDQFARRRCRSSSTAPKRRSKNICRSLAHGEILGAFCLTEPQAGSDAAGDRHYRRDAPTATYIA